VKEDILEGLVLDLLVIVEESSLDLLLGDLTELTGVAGSSGLELILSATTR
jgi:hypothetical protein